MVLGPQNKTAVRSQLSPGNILLAVGDIGKAVIEPEAQEKGMAQVEGQAGIQPEIEPLVQLFAVVNAEVVGADVFGYPDRIAADRALVFLQGIGFSVFIGKIVVIQRYVKGFDIGAAERLAAVGQVAGTP